MNEQSISDLGEKANSLVMSYNSIRRAVGWSGVLLPVLLGPVGWAFGIAIQDNMSSYYHTPLRDVFVGTMCAIGIFLFCYRGYDWIENWTANLGCVSALGVALFPLDENRDPILQESLFGFLHMLSGGLFFLTLAFYSLYHFPRSTSDQLEGAPHPWERNFIYRSSGIAILLSMIAMGSYLILLPRQLKELFNDFNFLFWTEWIAVWSFAAAWLTKGRVVLAEIAIELISIPRSAFAEKLKHFKR